MYAGKVRAKVAIKQSGLKFISVRSNEAKKGKQDSASEQAQQVTVDGSKFKTTEIRKSRSEKPDSNSILKIISVSLSSVVQ